MAKQLVISQILLLVLQDGCDVCLFPVIRTHLTDLTFEGNKSRTTTSASGLDTIGGVPSGLTDCVCADVLSALPIGDAVLLQTFLVGSWRDLRADFTS